MEGRMNPFADKIKDGKLELWNLLLGLDDYAFISDLLKENSITTLNIFDIRMGLDKVWILASGLRDNTTLTALYLASNNIGPEGAKHLADGLRDNTSLVTLDLWENKIGPEGAKHLVSWLRDNTSLVTLDLAHTDIGPEGIRHLTNGLQDNTCLLTYAGPGSADLTPILQRNKRAREAARTAAMCTVALKKFKKTPLMNFIDKNVVQIIAQKVWATRGEREWLKALENK